MAAPPPYDGYSSYPPAQKNPPFQGYPPAQPYPPAQRPAPTQGYTPVPAQVSLHIIMCTLHRIL